MSRSRSNDGAGKSEHTWEKHVLVGKGLRAQTAKASMVFGAGVIVDMHAHDGSGVPTPQPDFFGDGTSTSTPHIASEVAASHGWDVVLCEKNRERMAILKTRFSTGPIYLENNDRLTSFPWERYKYAAVINDPNGPSEHGIEVLEFIAMRTGIVTDFFVMINVGSLRRIGGVCDKGSETKGTKNGAAIIGLRQKKHLYAWMQDPMKWRDRLGKKQVATSRFETNGRGYRGQLIICSNSLAKLNLEMFACYK